jgi:hypothetical protein
MIYSNKELTDLIEDFMKKTGMSATAFGMKANKEPNLVFQIREGRGCGEEVQKRITDFIEGYDEEIH